MKKQPCWIYSRPHSCMEAECPTKPGGPEASAELPPPPYHFQLYSTFSSHPAFLDIPVSASLPPLPPSAPLQSEFSETVKAALLCSTVLITGLPEVSSLVWTQDPNNILQLYSSCLFCSLVAFSPPCIKIDVPRGLTLLPFCTVSLIHVMHPGFAHNLCTDLTLQLWPYVPLLRGITSKGPHGHSLQLDPAGTVSSSAGSIILHLIPGAGVTWDSCRNTLALLCLN